MLGDNINEKEDEFVFILTRHVNSKLTDKYWIESYNCIRILYPDVKIIIIDDNSNYEFVSEIENPVNVEVIQTEYPKCGELLPYYYFFKNKYAKKAVIIHDSVFFKNQIDIDTTNKVKFLWHHYHAWDNIRGEKEMISKLNHSNKLLHLYENKNNWVLSFGVMSVITYDFLQKIQDTYHFFNLLNVVKNRQDRMCLERVFGLLCHCEYPELIHNPSFFGVQSIFDYSFNDYINNLPNNNGAIKVYTGR